MATRSFHVPLVLALLLLAGCGGIFAESEIPERTVVLTFDDAARNHLTFVAPLLEEYGFGATFFITEDTMRHGREALTWPEVAELHRRGFEIGNHTSGHLALQYPDVVAARLAGDMDRMEARFAEHGIPAPTSFAWPGCGFGPEALAAVRARGYRFARRGMRPEVSLRSLETPPAYDPEAHDPLLIPSAELWSDWSLTRIRATLLKATRGRAVVLQLHGVPDPFNPDVSMPPARFRALLDMLRDGGYRVIALRDLARWVDPDRPVDDPLASAGWPRMERRSWSGYPSYASLPHRK
jgi:peptidoglycan/xylan/chitin deacetylase (PgdA/CDA1 family)